MWQYVSKTNVETIRNISQDIPAILLQPETGTMFGKRSNKMFINTSYISPTAAAQGHIFYAYCASIYTTYLMAIYLNWWWNQSEMPSGLHAPL